MRMGSSAGGEKMAEMDGRLMCDESNTDSADPWRSGDAMSHHIDERIIRWLAAVA